MLQPSAAAWRPTKEASVARSHLARTRLENRIGSAAPSVGWTATSMAGTNMTVTEPTPMLTTTELGFLPRSPDSDSRSLGCPCSHLGSCSDSRQQEGRHRRLQRSHLHRVRATRRLYDLLTVLTHGVMLSLSSQWLSICSSSLRCLCLYQPTHPTRLWPLL